VNLVIVPQYLSTFYEPGNLILGLSDLGIKKGIPEPDLKSFPDRIAPFSETSPTREALNSRKVAFPASPRLIECLVVEVAANPVFRSSHWKFLILELPLCPPCARDLAQLLSLYVTWSLVLVGPKE
jgi:hypothetical protein